VERGGGGGGEGEFVINKRLGMGCTGVGGEKGGTDRERVGGRKGERADEGGKDREKGVTLIRRDGRKGGGDALSVRGGYAQQWISLLGEVWGTNRF
jgi:hypothetical protein